MRTRINNITFTPGTRSITTGITDLTIDDIRLFINESQMKVICSSMQKDNVISISSGVVTYKDTFPALASGDHITFEIDKGDNGAKQGSNPNTSLTSIDDKIDDFYDTFDADIASLLYECIGEDEESDESSSDESIPSLSEVLLSRLRTLLESYDTLAGVTSPIVAELESGKAAVADAIVAKGGTSQATDSLYEMAQEITAMPLINLDGTEFSDGVDRFAQALSTFRTNCIKYSDSFTQTLSVNYYTTFLNGMSNLTTLEFSNLTSISHTSATTFQFFESNPKLERVSFPKLTSVYLGNATVGTNAYLRFLKTCNILTTMNFPLLSSITATSRNINQLEFLYNVTSLETAIFPRLVSVNCYSGASLSDNEINFLRNAPALKTFKMANEQDVMITDQIGKTNAFYSFNDSKSLIDITIGRQVSGVGIVNANVFILIGWFPSLAVQSAELLQEMNTNIRNNIVANLYDRTGSSSLTFYFNTNMQSYLEQATLDAFAAKNWTVAYRTT